VLWYGVYDYLGTYVDLCYDYDCGFVSCPVSGTYRAISIAIYPFWSIFATYLDRDRDLGLGLGLDLGPCQWTWIVDRSAPGTTWSCCDGVYVAPEVASRSVRIYCFDDDPW
jgi:hypothetical protein